MFNIKKFHLPLGFKTAPAIFIATDKMDSVSVSCSSSFVFRTRIICRSQCAAAAGNSPVTKFDSKYVDIKLMSHAKNGPLIL